MWSEGRGEGVWSEGRGEGVWSEGRGEVCGVRVNVVKIHETNAEPRCKQFNLTK